MSQWRRHTQAPFITTRTLKRFLPKDSKEETEIPPGQEVSSIEIAGPRLGHRIIYHLSDGRSVLSDQSVIIDTSIGTGVFGIQEPKYTHGTHMAEDEDQYHRYPGIFPLPEGEESPEERATKFLTTDERGLRVIRLERRGGIEG